MGLRGQSSPGGANYGRHFKKRLNHVGARLKEVAKQLRMQCGALSVLLCQGCFARLTWGYQICGSIRRLAPGILSCGWQRKQNNFGNISMDLARAFACGVLVSSFGVRYGIYS